MGNLPLRQLGGVGVVPDANAFDLPPNAFSDCMNVRFVNGRITRLPIFRVLEDTLTPSNVVHVFSSIPPTGYHTIYHVADDGSIYSLIAGAETDITNASYTPSVDPRPHTSCVLANVTYFNRPDAIPYYYDGGSTVLPLPDWTSTHRCDALRKYKDFLIALNVTKGATQYGQMVKWSDIALAGAPPASWDETDTTKSAGENTIAELDSELMDGGALGDTFILYARDAVWAMNYIGGNAVFAFRGLFDDVGIINQNCFVEVDGRHYVFGASDIYVHDGVTKVSIADERIREKWFKELNQSDTDKFFVHYDRLTKCVFFCARSGNAEAAMTETTYCNVAAVFNTVSKTWSFADLPNVSSASRANSDTIVTWDTVSASLTWANAGGSWYDQDDSAKQFTVWASCADATNGLTSSKLLTYDWADIGSVPLIADSESAFPAFVERIGMDLDSAGIAVRSAKTVRHLFPQIKVYVTGVSFDFSLGYANTASADPTWGAATAFNPTTDYKIDSKTSGRYLATRVELTTQNDFSWASADVDVVALSHR